MRNLKRRRPPGPGIDVMDYEVAEFERALQQIEVEDAAEKEILKKVADIVKRSR